MKGTQAGGGQDMWFLKDSFAFLFMAKKKMKTRRWQEKMQWSRRVGEKQDEWMEETEQVSKTRGQSSAGTGI